MFLDCWISLTKIIIIWYVIEACKTTVHIQERAVICSENILIMYHTYRFDIIPLIIQIISNLKGLEFSMSIQSMSLYIYVISAIPIESVKQYILFSKIITSQSGREHHVCPYKQKMHHSSWIPLRKWVGLFPFLMCKDITVCCG